MVSYCFNSIEPCNFTFNILDKKKRQRIILIGGLGNVLYQLNAIQGIDNLDIDIGLLSRKSIHAILGWTFHDSCSTLNLDRENVVKSGYVRIIFDMFMIYLVRTLGIKNKKYCWEQNLTNIFCGYFQDPKWLCNGVDSEYIIGFLKKQSLAHTKCVGVVHYRMGDSVWRLEYGDYYDYLTKMIIETNYVVLTDSPEELKSTFFNHNIEIRKGPILEDFYTMVNSDHLVVSPSTLSWWAAMLKTHGVVTMPKKLYAKLGFNNAQVELRCI